MKRFNSPGELQSHFDQQHETENESAPVVCSLLTGKVQVIHSSLKATHTPLVPELLHKSHTAHRPLTHYYGQLYTTGIPLITTAPLGTHHREHTHHHRQLIHTIGTPPHSSPHPALY